MDKIKRYGFGRPFADAAYDKLDELVEGYNVSKARLDAIAKILHNVVKRVDELVEAHNEMMEVIKNMKAREHREDIEDTVMNE